MASAQNPAPNVDLFDAYFRRADLDRDGRISGAEAVSFFQGSGLPKQVLAQVTSSLLFVFFFCLLFLLGLCHFALCVVGFWLLFVVDNNRCCFGLSMTEI